MNNMRRTYGVLVAWVGWTAGAFACQEAPSHPVSSDQKAHIAFHTAGDHVSGEAPLRRIGSRVEARISAVKGKPRKDDDVKIKVDIQVEKGGKTETLKEEYDDVLDLHRDLRKKFKKLGIAPEEDLRFHARPMPRQPGEPPRFDQWMEEWGDGRKFPKGDLPGGFQWSFPPQRREQARSNQPWIGIHMQELDEDLAEVMGVKEGVVVAKVVDSSPAMKAGLKAGDVITKINKTMVDDPDHIRDEVMDHKVGDVITVALVREGKSMAIDVKLARHGEAESSVAPANWLGVAVEMTPLEATGPGGVGHSEQGITVTDVDEESPAEVAGLRLGDVIVSVERRPVTTVKEFTEAITRLKGKKILLLIERGGARMFVVAKEANS